MQRLPFDAGVKAIELVKQVQKETKMSWTPPTITDARVVQRALKAVYSQRSPHCWSVLSQNKTLQPVGRSTPTDKKGGWMLEKPKLPWYVTLKYEDRRSIHIRYSLHSLYSLYRYVTLKYEDGPPGLPHAWSSNTTGSNIEFEVVSQGLGTINLWYLSSPWRKAWLERVQDFTEQLGTVDCHLTALSPTAKPVSADTHRFNASDARDEYSQGRDGGSAGFTGLTPGEKYKLTCVLVEGRFMLFAVFTE
jgi:hypothetical protein